MKSLGRILRSVQAFGRGLTSGPAERAAIGAAPRIGLALGGGFARGIAHIGVLKVLEEEQIPISYVAGTSVGALIGAAYCGGLSAAELEEVAARVRFRDFARWTLSRFGFATNQRMIGFLNSILKVKSFEELRIPLAVTATDFATGQGVLFHSGPLVDPVRASCAYPGMFLPVNIGGRLLVDGMLAYSVPAEPLRKMGADRVIASAFRAHWVNDTRGPRHVLDVIGQCFSIIQDRTCRFWQENADLVIEPEVGKFSYEDFSKARDLIDAGEAAARKCVPAIRQWLITEAPKCALKPAAPVTRMGAVSADLVE